MMPGFKDLTGQRFGRLTAVKPVSKDKNGNYQWLCKCDCGNQTNVNSDKLIRNYTKSCGCLRVEQSRQNGTMLTESGKLNNNRDTDRFKGTRVGQLNRKNKKPNKSGTKGVYLHNNGWVAAIMFRGHNIYLGYFGKLEDAIKARKEAEEKYFQPVIEEYKATREGLND